MKWLALVFLVGCIDGGRSNTVSLEGPYSCGTNTCSTGEVCLIRSSGSQCDVNADAGIGQYQDFEWRCVAVPKECHGAPSCDCINTGPWCSEAGRTINHGCI